MAAKNFKETRLYKLAFEQAMDIFEASKCFPKEELYSLTDQVRRSSRSVCANIAEAYRKKRYPLHFISKSSVLTQKIPKLVFGWIFHIPASMLTILSIFQ